MVMSCGWGGWGSTFWRGTNRRGQFSFLRSKGKPHVLRSMSGSVDPALDEDAGTAELDGLWPVLSASVGDAVGVQATGSQRPRNKVEYTGIGARILRLYPT